MGKEPNKHELPEPDAEDRFLEAVLEQELRAGRTSRLAERVRSRLEIGATRQDDKETIMTPLDISTGSWLGRHLGGWSVAAGLAGILVVAAALGMAGVFDGERDAPIVGTDPASSPNDPVIHNAKELEALPPGLNGLEARNVDDVLLNEIVRKQPGLRRLVINSMAITDDGLDALLGLPSLEHLGLPCCARITDAGVATVAKLSGLQGLDVTGFVGQTASFGEPDPDYVSPYSQLTDACMKDIVKLRKLRSLDLSGTLMGADALAILLANPPAGLHTLAWNMAGLRHDDLPALAGLERVEDLAFTGNAWLNDADLEVICRMKGLRRLLVGGNGFQSAEFGARGMRALARHPSLRAVGLDQVRLTSSDVEPLFTKGNWEEIVFNSVTGLNDQMIDNLAGRNPGLRRLTIQDCPSFDGSGLRAFDSSQLEVLDISGGGLADQNLIDFARANRHCRITTWRGKPWALEHARLLIHDPTFKAVEDAVVVIVDQADGRVVGQAELRSYLMERRALYVGPTTNPMVPRILVYDTCVLAPGNYRALIHAPGFHAEELDFSIMEGERQELSLALRPGSALDGNRRRAWSTEPARFEVVAELASMNGIDPTQVQFTLTDDSDDPVMRSTFEVTDQRGTQGNVFTVPAGIWRVHAFAVGATPMQTTVQVVPGSTAQAHLGTNR